MFKDYMYSYWSIQKIISDVVDVIIYLSPKISDCLADIEFPHLQNIMYMMP